jgi:dTDP-4-dehydrorhamnose reductase
VYAERGADVCALGHDGIEITEAVSCRGALATVRPDLVVNTAAFHNVESCESDPARAFRANALGPHHLAMLAAEMDFALVQVSTDYVFDGRKQAPYVETDGPMPLNVYGNSKLAGEYAVRAAAPRHFVVRVCGLFGRAPCRAKKGLNFVQRMLKLASERDEVRVVDDEIVCPTYTRAAAEQLADLTATEAYGLYHMVSRGACSWHAFAAEIFRLAGSTVTLSVAAPGEFPAKVPRPRYSALENRALADLQLDRMPHWKDALKRYLKDIGSP